MELRKKLNTVLNSPFVVFIRNLVDCINSATGLKDAIKDMIEAFKTLGEYIVGFASPTTWTELLVNLICGWEKLGTAWTALKTAWSATTSETKYTNYGSFMGNIIAAMTGTG